MTLKIGVYLTDDVARRFRTALKRTGVSKSALVNEALAHFLDPPPPREPGEKVLQVLYALLKRTRRLQRETEILGETLALFVRYFLTISPPLPEADQEEAQALGRQRYQIFIRRVAKTIASDKGLVTDVMGAIVKTHPELVARAVAEAAASDAPASEPPPFDAGLTSSPRDVDGLVSHA